MVKKLLPAFVIGILAASLGSAQAGEAVFSKDGNTIFLVPLFEEGKLHVLDLAKQEHKTVSLGGALEGKSISAVVTANSGGVLLAAEQALWQWQPGDKEPKKLADFPAGYQVRDLSVVKGKQAEEAERIFAMAEQEDVSTLLVQLPGERLFRKIFSRRCEPGSAPQADAQGRLFLAADSDVWEACLDDSQEDGSEPSEVAGFLSGCRIAPLAMMNTDATNGGSMAVQRVVPAGEQLIALCGGRHRGGIVLFAPPVKALYGDGSEDEHPDLAAQIGVMKRCLENAKVLYEGDPCDALCAHAGAGGGVRVFWRQGLQGEQTWMLMEGGTAPRPIGKERPR